MATNKVYRGTTLIFGDTATSYNDIYDYAYINGVEVKGNLTLKELGLYSRSEIDSLGEAVVPKTIKFVTELDPTTAIDGATYYLHTDGDPDDYYTIHHYSSDTGFTQVGSTAIGLDKTIYQTIADINLNTPGQTVVNGGINVVNAGLDDKLDVINTDFVTTMKKTPSAINELETYRRTCLHCCDKRTAEIVTTNATPGKVSNTLYLVY